MNTDEHRKLKSLNKEGSYKITICELNKYKQAKRWDKAVNNLENTGGRENIVL
ncbi:MAG: hypothetical protein KAS99_04760 [Candidatus Omnitrophica bacterium]|nr:hypothetical protein [Candidatus Omnitrophota bacterium]